MKHVLIISSNVMQSKRIDVILTLEGFSCIPVLEGEEALNILLKERFDIVFLDENISGITPLNLAAHLKKIKLKLPIVVIRSKLQEEEIISDEENLIYTIDRSVISNKLPEIIKQILK